MEKLQSFHSLFLHELQDLYSAEVQMVESLPKMIRAAAYAELQNAFQNHYEETRQQLTRLQRVFAMLGVDPGTEPCLGVQGLIREATEILQSTADPSVKDAALISVAQKIEHYEIASYGTICTWAKLLDYDDALDLLKETVDEEKKADEKLSDIAKDTINQAAALH
ncbi:MAG TPA: ferritin-like domain-containing protein [Acidobacteriota bacterium]|jgi:ferritin-like metal-binding protein YciE